MQTAITAASTRKGRERVVSDLAGFNSAVHDGYAVVAYVATTQPV